MTGSKGQQMCRIHEGASLVSRVWQFQNKTFPSNQTPWASCDLPLGSAGPGSSFFSRLPTAERKQG